MKKIILASFLLFLCLGAAAQRIDATRIYNHIEFLSSDELNGRATATDDEVKAARYIAKKFRQLGLLPMGSDGYYYPFDYKVSKNPKDSMLAKTEPREGTNVVAFLDNGAFTTIVIGAHFDHLGLGHDHNSLDANPEGKIHNGADDNASGVAGVLELARYFSENDFIEKNNFLFMTFSGEELGLLGSKKWCENPTLPLEKINYMINMDMIGRLNDSSKKLLVFGIGTSSAWKEVLEKTNQYFSIKEDSAGIGPSDQTSFYLKNIPVLHFFTGQHSDYHKPSDDIEKINIEGEVKVLELIIDVVEALDSKPKLSFFKTQNAETPRMSFKVTMGVMPDYTYEEKGMRLDGVTDNKPAAKGGLLGGDIIIQIGNAKIESVKDYMKVLATLKKGDKVKVILMRKGEMMAKDVEL
ncbi:MAG: M20/M25/M40 family metallo-hydrolase [Bacteroidetes bacterium]|nr:M20/M25/M40 family metallo-hydrolase [Bacteroidota bacterium]